MDPWHVLALAIAVPTVVLAAILEVLVYGKLSAWAWRRLRRR